MTRAMSNKQLLLSIERVVSTEELHQVKAARLAQLIREYRSYRWVGIYAVDGADITLLGSSAVEEGPGTPSPRSRSTTPGGLPAYPRFPVEQGLCGAAVSSRSTVVAADVANDPRYLK